MRVVLLTPELPELPDGGGIGTNTEVVSRALAARGHDVLVLRLGDAASEEQRDGVVIRTLRRRWLPDHRAELTGDLLRLAAAARGFRADVVHAAEWGALGWAVARLTRIPLVTRLATPTYLVDEINAATPSPREAHRRRLERDQTRHSARVYAPSRAIAARVGADWGLPVASLPVVPNSVHVASIAAARDVTPTRPVPDRFVVLLGRVEHRKGIRAFGAALAALLPGDPDLHAVVIGKVTDDESSREFQRRTAAFADRVHLVGEVPRTEALAIAARATVGVVPSLWESFGYVCVELMALGVPVVASRVGGLAEIVEDGRSGLLVEPDDDEGLTKALSAVLTDDGLRASLAAGGRERAAAYDESVVIARVEEQLTSAARPLRFDREVFHGDYAEWFQPEDEHNPFRREYERKRRLILSMFSRDPGQSVLDVGGGYGRVARPLGARHRVTMCDLGAPMLRKARAAPGGDAVALVQADALRLPFADASFDAVVAVDLVCHLPQLADGLAELARVVRPGGRVVFDTTNARPWWVLLHPSYVAWRPRRLVRTLRMRGVLPEWPQVTHHLPAEVRAAALAVGLRLEPVGAVGRAGVPKWHVWQAERIGS